MIYTIGWGLIVLAFLVLEAVALFNSRKGDSFSEHVWALLGVKTKAWYESREDWFKRYQGIAPSTPKWTLRVARTAFLVLCVWLVVHFTTRWV